MEDWKTLCDEMSYKELEDVIHYCKRLKEKTNRHSLTVPLNTTDEELEEMMYQHAYDYGEVVKITRRKQIGEISVRISFESR